MHLKHRSVPMTDPVLKPCPFCGKKGQTTPTGTTNCSNDQCAGYWLDMPPDEWNTRAGEKSEWISVDKCLPKEGVSVLTYTKLYGAVQATLGEEGWEADHTDNESGEPWLKNTWVDKDNVPLFWKQILMPVA